MALALGASALVFETLWFHEAGLALGNSVWSTSLILSSFMAGLALGNGLIGRYGPTLRRPTHAYAAAETLIAVAGVALTNVFPMVAAASVPLVRPFLDHAVALNSFRFGVAFVLMLVPTTAMGATLPLLVGALSSPGGRLGRVLGRLYGWNTLGAVVGVLLCEIVLIARFGIKGAALVAAALNLAAALTMVLMALTESQPEARWPSAVSAAKPSLTPMGRRLLWAAFVAGGLLLALEVVWFRFLTLFVVSSSLVFSFLLAVILAGIALGGLLGGHLIARHSPALSASAGYVALGCGIACVATYAGFQVGMPSPFWTHNWRVVLAASIKLMLPTSLLSGVLFTWLGDLASREIGHDTRTTGLLTLANTTGAMIGAFLGGFVLLPNLGMERSFLVLASGYGFVAVCIGAPRTEPARHRRYRYGAWALFVAVLAFFPVGLMQRRYFLASTSRYMGDGAATIETREGLTETIHYMRKDFLGKPLYYRLVTNGFSMSATVASANRYMKLYTYWPAAVHPGLRSALLISYGVGITAKSLTDTRSLERIDIVDPSRDILDLNRLVYPDPRDHPLNDPRVTVHIEDGRYFLLTTPRKFDLITGEPPPPRVAQTVNLYTREYFGLLRDRLTDGGITTYWLPVHQLLVSDALAILRSFCDVFEDCSLWAGSGYDWMMVGTRGARGPVSEEHFSAQWRDPLVGPELRALGLEVPEQLGALFMADAPALARLTRDSPPLVDDFPKRFVPMFSGLPADRFDVFQSWMDTTRARSDFARSEIAGRLWPPSMRSRTPEWFDVQRIINYGLTQGASVIINALFGTDPPLEDTATVDYLLTHTHLRTLPMWLLGSSEQQQRSIDEQAGSGRRDGTIEYHLGIRGIVNRRFDDAAAHLATAQKLRPSEPQIVLRRLYALCLAGRPAEAQAAADAFVDRAGLVADQHYWRFLTPRCGINPPATPAAVQ